MKVLTDKSGRTRTKSSEKHRPLRIYKNNNNRKKYARRLGKKLYIKTKGRMTNRNVVKVVVNNHITRHPTTKTPSSKKKSAFTQKLDKSHTPIPNSPYHQAPPVVVVPQNASSVNDNDNKHAGELARLKRQYAELETKHKEITPPIGNEPVGVKIKDESDGKSEEKRAEERAIASQERALSEAQAIASQERELSRAGQRITPLKTPVTPPSVHDSGSQQRGKIRTSFSDFTLVDLILMCQILRIKYYAGKNKEALIKHLLDRTFNNNTEADSIKKYWNDQRARGLTNDNNEDGMTTSEIAQFLDIKTHHIVPVVAKDQMDLLLPFVNSSTKQFYFVINSDPITKSGSHWRAGGIDINDGSCFFYDPLANDCDISFQKGMKNLIDKIHPNYYLKFKINKIVATVGTSVVNG